MPLEKGPGNRVRFYGEDKDGDEDEEEEDNGPYLKKGEEQSDNV